MLEFRPDSPSKVESTFGGQLCLLSILKGNVGLSVIFYLDFILEANQSCYWKSLQKLISVDLLFTLLPG